MREGWREGGTRVKPGKRLVLSWGHPYVFSHSDKAVIGFVAFRREQSTIVVYPRSVSCLFGFFQLFSLFIKKYSYIYFLIVFIPGFC